MKKIFILLLSISICFSSTKEKIKKYQKDLEISQEEQESVGKKVSELILKINQEKELIDKIDQNIINLSGILVSLQETYDKETSELNKLKLQNEILKRSKRHLESRIVQIISEDLSFDLLQPRDKDASINNILADEFVKSFTNIADKKLDSLMQKYEDLSSQIEEKDKKIKELMVGIDEYNEKKAELDKYKLEQENIISILSQNKDEYVKRLDQITKEQEEIKKMLEELKIINDKEEREKARIEQEKNQRKKPKKKEEEANKSTSESVMQDERITKINEKVKLYGSSYQASRVRKYSGEMTISPIENPYIKRNFGSYTDPIYGIKIFNDSITLGTKGNDTRVRSVLPGKIILIKNTSMLDNIIIIEHSNGVHTIYAHLSKIAPTIKTGSYVKKGYIIGRINKTLDFSVTQKNYYINPLQLIKL